MIQFSLYVEISLEGTNDQPTHTLPSTEYKLILNNWLSGGLHMLYMHG